MGVYAGMSYTWDSSSDMAVMTPWVVEVAVG